MAERDGRGPRAGRRAIVLGGRRAAEAGAELAARLAPAGRWIARAWAEEQDSARLAPWLAVGFGSGILLYFAAPAEPSLAGAAAGLALVSLIAWFSRARPHGFAVAAALVAIFAGFAAASMRAALVHQPILTRPTGTVTLTGFVEARDATERSERIVVRVTGGEGVPARVRVALRAGAAPEVGAHVQLLARLQPLVGPVRPGGYDFARDGYFAGLGATGFALGRPRAAAPPHAPPVDLRFWAAVESLRTAVADRIAAVLPGDSGAIAVALVTGIRDRISPETNEAMRISGLYHVLAISGLHMALVAGTLFLILRTGLALVPGLALRHPIKKWAAVAAFAGVTFYLLLSGAKIATQRSFVMIAIVLVGVLLDRPALTIRTLAAAAFAVLALHPEALLNPSFQMSFAATLALVALFERYARLLATPPAANSNAFTRLSARAWRWLLFGAATTLVAGLATTAYVAFHFHRIAPYGVLANVPAMPLISLLVMPAGILSVLLIPFGYDALGWKLMGAGIEMMLAVARFVAALPGANGRVAAFGPGALLVATAGLLLLALPASRLRLVCLPVFAAAIVLAAGAPRPDVLVSGDGTLVAVRGADGKLAILEARRGRFTADSWLRAEADPRPVSDELARGFACDADGCIARVSGGAVVAVARDRAAFLDDCGRAALLITRLDAPRACSTPAIDRATLATTGAVALYRAGEGWRAEAARPPDSDRPWYARAVRPDPAALMRLQRRAVDASRADEGGELDWETDAD